MATSYRLVTTLVIVVLIMATIGDALKKKKKCGKKGANGNVPTFSV